MNNKNFTKGCDGAPLLFLYEVSSDAKQKNAFFLHFFLNHRPKKLFFYYYLQFKGRKVFFNTLE